MYIAVCMMYVLIYLFWYLNFVLVQVSVHTRIYIYTLYTQLVLYLFICMCVYGRIGVMNCSLLDFPRCLRLVCRLDVDVNGG